MSSAYAGRAALLQRCQICAGQESTFITVMVACVIIHLFCPSVVTKILHHLLKCVLELLDRGEIFRDLKAIEAVES